MILKESCPQGTKDRNTLDQSMHVSVQYSVIWSDHPVCRFVKDIPLITGFVSSSHYSENKLPIIAIMTIINII
jgi:hypothetical protein